MTAPDCGAVYLRSVYRMGKLTLLLLAIPDDAIGLVILAVFYPSRLTLSAPIALMVTAVLVAVWLRRRRTQSFWPYVLGPGALSWAALYFGGSTVGESYNLGINLLKMQCLSVDRVSMHLM